MTCLCLQIGTFLTRLVLVLGKVVLTIALGALSLVVFMVVSPLRAACLSSRLKEMKSDWHGEVSGYETEVSSGFPKLAEATHLKKVETTSQSPFQLSYLLSKTGNVPLAKAMVALTTKTGLFIFLATASCFGQFSTRHAAVRISEDNDWFTGSDRYYTNGIRIDYIFEPQRRALIDRLLLTANIYNSRVRGVGLVQTMYTPNDISKWDFTPGDHPYAGALYLVNFQETFHTTRKIKVYSELDLGVIGPDSFAGETQTWFHKLIHNQLPLGWNHQVESSAIVNYTASIEKGLFSTQYVEIIGHAGADFGTAMTDVNTGLIIRAGLLDQYFSSRFHQDGKFHAYVFFKSGFMWMVEDKTLQGKVEGSQYAIRSDEINRALWRLENGITVTRKWFALSYSTVMLAKEFAHGGIHHYGNVTMAFKIH